MKIYGVDTDHKVTPLVVRDAIIVCFRQAHAEVLKLMEECAEDMPKKEIEKMKNIEIKMIVKRAFKDAGEDFDKPTKKGLVKVIGGLAKFAAQFRRPEIIKKHYKEIKILIEKIEE